MASRVNLVPRSERPRTTTDFGLLAMLGLFIVVIFGLGFGYYLFGNMLDSRKQELADLQQQTVQLQQQVAALQEYERLATQREDVQAVVQSIYSRRTLVSDVLDAISLVVPENVWFQTLTLTASDPVAPPSGATDKGDTGNSITIAGQTYTFEDVSRLLVRLQLIPSLKGVQLTSATQAEEATSSTLELKGFTIGASVINTQPLDSPLPLAEVEVEGQ